MYKAGLPDDSINVSQESQLGVAVKLTLALAVISTVIYLAAGYIIGYAVSSITPEQEAKLGKLVSFDLNISNNDNSYLSSVSSKLSKCAKIPYDIRVKVMEDDEANAFAVPGGWIYVTSGIIKKMNSENELAFIIGHELGHFKHRDHLRALGFRLVFGLLSMVLGSDYGAATSMSLGMGSSRYSQSAELEADAFGLEVMNCAYGTTAGATKLFEKMDDGKEWRYFMSTHPGFKERVARMEEIIADKGYDASQKLLPLGKF